MLRLFFVRTYSDAKNRIKLRFRFLIGIRFYQYQHEAPASEFCGNLHGFTRWRFLMLRLFVVRTFSDANNRIKLRFQFLIVIRFYQYQHEAPASEFCGNLHGFTRWRFVLVLKAQHPNAPASVFRPLYDRRWPRIRASGENTRIKTRSLRTLPTIAGRLT